MRFKEGYVVAALSLLIGVSVWLVAGVAVSQMPVPPDFSFEETKPLAAVTFSHKFHVTEKKLQCPECHVKPFQMKKGTASAEMTMAKLNEGEFCGKCHNGTKAFATKDAKSCAKCHVKK